MKLGLQSWKIQIKLGLILELKFRCSFELVVLVSVLNEMILEVRDSCWPDYGWLTVEWSPRPKIKERLKNINILTNGKLKNLRFNKQAPTGHGSN